MEKLNKSMIKEIVRKILQEYTDKKYILFRDQKEAEELLEIAFLRGFEKATQIYKIK